MLTRCPNKNLEEWKDLESTLGSEMAMRAYKDNGMDVPDFTKAPNGKKSTLLEELKEIKEKEGAYRDKFTAGSYEFRNWFGDWKRYGELSSKENLDFTEKAELDKYKSEMSDKVDSNFEPLSTWIDKFNREYDPTAYPQQEEETLGEVAQKIGLIKDVLPAEFKIDPDIEGAGQLEYGENYSPVIKINPNYADKTTVFHEGGHLYIDFLGGMDNTIVQEGVYMLRGSQLEEEVSNNYPELSGRAFDKELLATAIGREAAEIFDNRKSDLIERFKAWVEKFFNTISSLLGLPVNRAKQLARDLNTGRLQELNSVPDIENAIQQQKKGRKETSEEKKMARKEEIAENLLKRLNRRLDETARSINSARENDDVESKQKTKEKLSRIIEDMNKADTDHKILQFINNTYSTAKDFNDLIESEREKGKFENTTYSSNMLEIMREKLDAYKDIAEDIESKLLDNPDYLSSVEQEGVDEQASNLVRELKRLQQKYDDISYEHLKKILATSSGRIFGKYREMYRREFEKNYSRRGRKKQEYEDAKLKYINDRIKENFEKILEEEREHMGNLLLETDSDIDSISNYLVSMKHLNDDLIARAVEMLDDGEHYNMVDFTEEFKKADEVFVKFAEEKPEGNQVKKYDEMLEDEVDGEGNYVKGKRSEDFKSGYLVDRYFSKFYREKARLWREYNELKETDPGKAEKFRNETINPWLRRNSYKSKGQTLPRDHWKNPQYDKLQELREKGSAIPQTYDYLLKLSRLTRDNYPDHVDLGMKTPYVDRNGVERLYQNGLVGALRDQIKEAVGLNPTDFDYGDTTKEIQDKYKGEVKDFIETNLSLSGKRKQDVPIFFRGQIPKSQQSFDLLSTYLLDYYMSMNYSRKQGIATDLKVLSDKMASRKVHSRNPLNFLFGDKHGTAWEHGYESNAYDNLNHIIQDRVYNIKTAGSPELAQKLQVVRSWASNIMLIGNLGAGAATFVQGKVMNWIESFAGELFTVKNARNAEAYYSRDVANGSMVADMGRRRWFSLTNLLVERFDVTTDWRPVAERFSDDNRAKQLFKTSTAHATHQIPEHHIQAVTMYSILDSKKVKDKEGNFITKDGKKTSERSEGISAAQAYELVYDENGVNTGRTKLRDDVEKIEGYEDRSLKEAEAGLAREIKMVNLKMYGNYSKNNQAKAQRNMWLDQGFHLRGWLVPGTLSRWRGVRHVLPGKLKGKPEESAEDERFYNRALGRFEEGYYVTGLKFGKRLAKDIFQLKWDVQSHWHEMSNHEKTNIIRFTGELGAAALLWAMARMLYLSGEDEDNEETANWYYTGAFLARRVYSELRFYSSVGEFFNILRTPSATMSMLERIGRLLTQLTSDPLEKYERTDWKGQYKIEKDLYDLFGFGWNQLNRDMKEAVDYLYLNPPGEDENE